MLRLPIYINWNIAKKDASYVVRGIKIVVVCNNYAVHYGIGRIKCDKELHSLNNGAV